jgi:glycosyltransferase involved in cell wall biosynthesis
MARVVVLGHSAQPSGAELALLRILPHVPGIDPLVVLAEDGPLVPMLMDRSIPTRVVPMSRRALDVRRDAVTPTGLPLAAVRDVASYIGALTGYLRQQGVGRRSIIHTNTIKAHVYGGAVARRLGARHVMHLHDRLSTDYLPAAAVGLMRAVAAASPHALVANSAATMQTVSCRPRRRGPLRAIVANPAPPSARQSPQPDKAHFDVGMVGRIAPWKGQDVFLRAYAEAFGTDPTVRAHVVGAALFGEHEVEQSARRLADELGIADRVEWHGHVPDAPAMMAGFDTLVHASTIPEPFGQVVIEGMAAGVPVIATNAGAPAELVSDGRDGLLVAPGDAAAMAAALRRLRGDDGLRAALVAQGRLTAAGFTPAASGEALGRVYDAVLATG